MTLEERIFKRDGGHMECDREAFGLEIKLYRLRQGLTQRELGKQWGISRHTIIRAENAQNITWESAYKLAAKLAAALAREEPTTV